MRNIRTAALLAAALAVGCAGNDGPTLSVEVTSPSVDVYVRQGDVTLQIAVAGGTPERVDLLRNGALFATLELPYQYTWVTDLEAEGSYSFVARARLGDRTFDSEPTTVVIDRTAPVSLSGTLVANAKASGPFFVMTSESVRPPAGGVRLTTEGGAPIPFILVASENSLGVLPTVPVATPGRVRLRLDGVTDLAGNPLPSTEVLFDVPVWRQLDTSWSPSPVTNPAAPSVAIRGDLLAVSLPNKVVRCQSGVCLGSTLLVDELPLAMTSGGQLLTASAQGWGAVQLWEWTLEGVAARGDPLWGTGHKYSVALGARAVAAGGHDAIATWSSSSGLPEDQDLAVEAVRVTNGTVESLGRIAGGTGGLNYAWSGGAALAPDGTAYAAILQNYDDGGDTSRRVEVRSWNGLDWALVGTPLGKSASFPAFVVDAGGDPWVAFTESGFGYGYVRVLHWNGTDWEELDAIGAGEATYSFAPSLAIDETGAPVVAFLSHAPGGEAETQARVRRWSGAAWTAVGGALNASTRAARGVRVATDDLGNAAVTFFEWTGEGTLYYLPATTWDLRLVQLNR